jgi:hypothetical protein
MFSQHQMKLYIYRQSNFFFLRSRIALCETELKWHLFPVLSSINTSNRPKITDCHLNAAPNRAVIRPRCGGVTSDTDRWIRHRGIYLCENNTKANMIWTRCSVAALQVGEKKEDREKEKRVEG